MKTIVRTRTETTPGMAGILLSADSRGAPDKAHPGPGPFSILEARKSANDVRGVLLTVLLVLYPTFGSVVLVLTSLSLTGTAGLG